MTNTTEWRGLTVADLFRSCQIAIEQGRGEMLVAVARGGEDDNFYAIHSAEPNDALIDAEVDGVFLLDSGDHNLAIAQMLPLEDEEEE